jgi:NTE family protein
MKKCLSLLAVLLFMISSQLTATVPGSIKNWDPEGPGDIPTVAVVLSGGVALGFSHIGVLRAIEAAGIPIDMIAGTSMGGLVGGLYAAGYSPNDIELVTTDTDWLQLFTAPDSFLTYLSGPVIDDHKMLISFNFDSYGIGKTLGIISDQKILNKLSRLLIRVSAIRDFDNLFIPFRCVATDILTGEARIFDSGRLIESLRASMSIPGLFAPYPIDRNYYIDGGIVNNLPVDAAREMGADFVIVVNVDSEQPESILDFSSVVDIIIHTAGVVINANEAEQEKDADILIKPDLSGLDQAAFWRYSEFIERGEIAAEENREVLQQFAEMISAYRPLEFKDPDRVGDYFERPVQFATDVIQRCDEATSFPISMFEPLLEQPLSDEMLDRLILRVNQVLTSGSYESIGFGLTKVFKSDKEYYALELKPVYLQRGKHSLNAGFMFNGAYSTSFDSPGWLISPGFTTSLKFIELLGANSYIIVDLNLEEFLTSSIRFFMPMSSGIFFAPHISGGERSYTKFVNSIEESNIISFLEVGEHTGYRVNDFLEVGLDVMASFQWQRSGVPGSELISAIEILPLVIPKISWNTCLPSRFVHEGIRSKYQIAFSFMNPNSWYHQVVLEHEQFIPINLNGTFFMMFSMDRIVVQLLLPGLVSMWADGMVFPDIFPNFLPVPML